jgi:quinoprotein glucose dehydrogenase
MAAPRFPKPKAGLAAVLLGIALAIVGIVLLAGGVWLIAVGGSWYYGVAGVSLLISGVFIFRGDIRGAWIYVATCVVTVIWAFCESGLNGWALVPRIVAPSVLLVWLLAIVADLAPDGRRMRAPGFGALAAFIVILGIAIAVTNRSPVLSPVPDAQTAFNFDGNPAAGSDWPVYGGGASEQRYSQLTQIDLQTVKRLKRVWTYHTNELSAERPDKFGAETTPLKVGDTLYGCSGMDKAYALDAATGREKWSYDPHVDKAYIPYTASCRGLAYYKVPAAAPNDPCSTRIIWGTLDGRLIEVDADTGRLCTGFGRGGSVNITDNMGKVIPGMVAIDAPPVVVQGIVVTGHEVQDGQYRWAPTGAIHGYDAVTGQLKFVWDVMRPDVTTTPPAGQTYTRGTPNMWTAATGDEQLGLVYLPEGNSAGDYYSSTRRPLEKQVSSALVALDVHTGKPRWVFQTVKNDVWDYDLGSQPTLIEYPTGHGVVPAIILPSKTGEIYILDRRTGQPLTPVKTIAAPSGGVEPSERAPTQIVSGFATLRKPNLKESDMWGMSPIDQMICRIQFRMASYKGFFTPPTVNRRFVEYPGYNGGSDWGSIAVDPRRGIMVANYNDMPNYDKLITRAEADRQGIYGLGDPRDTKKSNNEDLGPQEGLPYGILVDAGWQLPFTRMLCKQPPYGWIRAIDLKTGKSLWDRPFGTARANGPFGLPTFLNLDIGTPNNGGPAVSAGGLVFIAAASDNLIRAIDIRTGKTVWSDVLPAGGQATPMLYEQNGKEYLVIMAGGHHFMKTPKGDQLVAYALP